MPLRLMLFDRLIELIRRYQLENLAKNAAYSFQGETSWVGLSSFLLELISSYQRFHLRVIKRLCANLDTSDCQYNPRRL